MLMEFYDTTKDSGRQAIEQRLNDINVPVMNQPPVRVIADVDQFCNEVQQRSAAIDELKQIRKAPTPAPRPPKEPQRHRVFHKLVTYPQEKRDKFAELYALHGKKWTAKSYALTIGVSVSAINNWRSLLKQGKSLEKCKNHNAYRLVLKDDQLLALSDILEHDRRDYTDAGLKEELQKRFPDRPSVSTSTICRALHSDRMKQLVGRDYTWKVESRRGPRANSDENKKLRREVTAELNEYIHKGKLWVAIDETHWDLHYGKRRAYAKRGEKAFTIALPWRTQLTAIVAIDSNGKTAYVDVVKGSVDATAFSAFFRTLAEEYKDEDVVFFLDNAPVHKKEELNNGRGYENHVILFNAPYSEELNPIEMFFSQWKRIVDDRVKKWPGPNEFIEILKSAVAELSRPYIRSLFNHVQTKVFPKVATLKDL